MVQRVHILDYGCGEGRWLKQNGGPGVIGLERSITSLHTARANAAEGTSFVLADGHHLPFKDDCFTTVRVWQVLHHMDDYRVGIDEIYRVLSGSLQIQETVDNSFLLRFGRRVKNTYKGVPVLSRFRSSVLECKIRECFSVTEIRHQAFVPPELLLRFLGLHMELPTRASRLYSAILRKVGLLRASAVWVEISALTQKRQTGAPGSVFHAEEAGSKGADQK